MAVPPPPVDAHECIQLAPDQKPNSFRDYATNINAAKQSCNSPFAFLQYNFLFEEINHIRTAVHGHPEGTRNATQLR